MTVAVLVSERFDPVSGRPTRNRNDAMAVALALTVWAPPALRLLHAGAMSDGTARDYLALGAPLIELISPAPRDTQALAGQLAHALGGTPLVLTGTRANGSFGASVLPYALAAALGRPVIADVIALEPAGEDWRVTQSLPRGARRHLRLAGPAVLMVSPNTALPLRHSFADGRDGQVLRTQAEAADARAAAPPGGEASAAAQRVPAARRLTLLEARIAQSGRARMQAALGSAAGAGAAGSVISAGTPEAKARAVLHYLRQHALIDF